MSYALFNQPLCSSFYSRPTPPRRAGEPAPRVPEEARVQDRMSGAVAGLLTMLLPAAFYTAVHWEVHPVPLKPCDSSAILHTEPDP